MTASFFLPPLTGVRNETKRNTSSRPVQGQMAVYPLGNAFWSIEVKCCRTGRKRNSSKRKSTNPITKGFMVYRFWLLNIKGVAGARAPWEEGPPTRSKRGESPPSREGRPGTETIPPPQRDGDDR